jgi:hypothetical protein
MMSGCARKQKEAKTTFQIFGNNLVNGTPMLGGIYLWAEPVGSGVFTKAVLDAEDSADIPFGTYNFHVVGFEGSNSFQGKRQCGSSVAPVVLNQATATVEMDLSSTNCSNSPFYKMSAEVISIPTNDFIIQLGGDTAISGGNSLGADTCDAVAVDQLGNIYCAGNTSGSLGETNGGSATPDAFVMKLDSSGNLIWITQLGATTISGGGSNMADHCTSVTVDQLGNVYCAGYTAGSLGESTGALNDAFVMKLDSSGNLVWLKQLGSVTIAVVAPSGNDKCLSVATDHFGNVYCGGTTESNLGDTNAGSGTSDAFVMKLDSSGNLVWLTQLGQNASIQPLTDYTGNDECRSISLDSSGNIYCAGMMNGGLGTGANAFVMKLDSSGVPSWIKEFGVDNSKNDYCNSVSSDSAGNTVCAGFTDGAIVSGESNGSTLPSINDAILIKLDSSGNDVWMKQFNTSTQLVSDVAGNDFFNSVTLDIAGNIYIAGNTTSSFGETNGGLNDALVMKLDSSGDPIWIKQFGSMTTVPGVTTQQDYCRSIALDKFGSLYCSGYTLGGFGETNGGSSRDVFVIKMRSDGTSFPSSGMP